MAVNFKILDQAGENVPYEAFQGWYNQAVSYPVSVESITGSKDGELAILLRVDRTMPMPRL